MNEEQVINQLREYWNQIDKKNKFTKYTMGECELISEKANKLILAADFFSKEEKESAKKQFDSAIKLSRQYHGIGEQTEHRRIMDVLINTKGGIEALIGI